MTDRMTYREENRSMESPHSAPLTELLGKDSIPDYWDTIANLPGAADSSEQPAKAPARTLLSHKKLESLREHLGERDLAILTAIRMSKYLTSDQMRRLYFMEHSTPTAAIRAANRNLGKLREMHLITAMTRRVGGIRGGSGSYIWHLTEAGERLLRLARMIPNGAPDSSNPPGGSFGTRWPLRNAPSRSGKSAKDRKSFRSSRWILSRTAGVPIPGSARSCR